MGTLNTTITNYYQSASKSGSGSVTDTQSSQAQLGAQQAANNWVDNNHGYYGSTSYSSSERWLGFTNSSSTSVGTPFYNKTTHVYTCAWNAAKSNTRNLLKLSFSQPADVDANSLGTATLNFTVPSGYYLTSGNNFYVCAAASTGSTLNEYKSSNSDTYDTNSKTQVTAQTSGGATYSINITNVFRQALATGQLWVALVMVNDDQYIGTNIKLSNGATIEYTIGYTPVGTPTGVSTSRSIQIPSTAVTISWSQASGGTNTSVDGYKIYWRAGDNPTTSTYTGTATVSGATTLSYSFTVPNSRGTTYYIKVQATCAQGASWDSSLSSTVTVTVNSLPGAPSVTASTSRVIASGGFVTFSNISAGTDADTSQTLSVYWNSSNSHTGQTLVSGNFSVNLTATTTYYFWTYDGLEYSSATTKTVSVVSAPTISGNITMAAVSTYTSGNDTFAYQINGGASEISGTNLSYVWQIISSSGSSTPSTVAGNAGSGTVSGTSVSLSNYDVTNLIGFNTSYTLRLKVMDDLGQTVQKDSATVFYIPAIQTVSGWYNRHADSDVTGSISSHFDSKMRIKFDKVMTGITRTIKYSTQQNMSNATVLATLNTSWNGTSQNITINDNAFTRGTTYYFRITFTLGQLTSNYDKTYTRAPDRTPSNIQLLPKSSTFIKPFTHDLCSVSFGGQGLAYDGQNDYGTGTIHTIVLGYPSSSPARTITMTPNSSYALSQGIVTNQLKLNTIISTANWTILLGAAPNSTYTVRVTVSTTNIFGTTFSNSINVTLDFIETFIGANTSVIFGIVTNNGVQAIPSTTPFYRLYSFQTLSFYITARAYASQNVTVRIVDNLGNTLINNKTFLLSTTNSGTINTYDGNGTFTYQIPYPLEYKDEVTFTVYLTLDNGQSTSRISVKCQYMRFNFTNVDLQITNVTKLGNGSYRIAYNVSDLGSTGASPKSSGYTSTEFLLYKLNRITGNYEQYSSSGTLTILTSGTCDFSGATLTEERSTFKLSVNVVNNFQTISSNTPTGQSTFIIPLDILSSFVFYDIVPTFSYDKNRLGINTAIPYPGLTDSGDNVLLIRPTQVGNNRRNKIYIGEEGYEGTLTLTNSGLIMDAIFIDGGSW